MKSATQPGDQEPLEPPLSLFDVAQLLSAMDLRIPAVTQVGLDTWMRSTPSLVEHLREIEQLKMDAVVSDPSATTRAFSIAWIRVTQASSSSSPAG